MGPRTEIRDNPNIALVSSNPAGFSDELLSRLKRRHWRISFRTSEPAEAFSALNEKKCSILLIQDTPDLPASVVLRAQIVEPLATITPTMVMCHDDHKAELGLIKEIGLPELFSSELNPGAFIGSFEFLIRRWSTGNLRKLYQARTYLLDRQFLPFSKLMTSLKGEEDIQALLAPCTAQILMRQIDFKAVETLLIGALTDHPRNIGIIANLLEFYLRAAMPDTALKLLQAARKNHGNTRLFVADQIQAHLMLNQVDQCIPILEDLINANYCREFASDLLARCLYAEGHLDRFQRLIDGNRHLLEKFKQQWNRSAS